jgi:hypothetical protein
MPVGLHEPLVVAPMLTHPTATLKVVLVKATRLGEEQVIGLDLPDTGHDVPASPDDAGPFGPPSDDSGPHLITPSDLLLIKV